MTSNYDANKIKFDHLWHQSCKMHKTIELVEKKSHVWFHETDGNHTRSRLFN